MTFSGSAWLASREVPQSGHGGMRGGPPVWANPSPLLCPYTFHTPAFSASSGFCLPNASPRRVVSFPMTAARQVECCCGPGQVWSLVKRDRELRV